MGVLRFLVARRDRLPADADQRAYMAGLDEIPWQARINWTDGGLDVDRLESDSGNFFVPCLVEGHGELMLSTASLIEREAPYQLEVEIARGTLNRLRNQMSTWESLGLLVGDATLSARSAALTHLAWAATHADDAESPNRALVAVHLALNALASLNADYVQQALAARHQQVGKLNTLWGADVGVDRPPQAMAARFVATFNTAQIPFVWREIEGTEGKRDWQKTDQAIDWCRAQGLKICSGPLLEVDRWALPDWMYLWGEGDEDSFRSCVSEHIQAVVDRYRGRVQLWQCAARLNTANDFDHDEETRLRLAALTIQAIRHVDPRAPVVISIDQPWGSFMGRQECDLSPIHFADALIRSELGLSGIGVELNFGYVGDGEPRDPIELGRQLDRWSTLGLPLMVNMCVASSDEADPLAQLATRVVNYSASQSLRPEAQAAWAARYLPVLLAKQPVQGVLWRQLSDSRPHALPHGGLFDAQDRPKPLLDALAGLRQQHLL